MNIFKGRIFIFDTIAQFFFIKACTEGTRTNKIASNCTANCLKELSSTVGFALAESAREHVGGVYAF